MGIAWLGIGLGLFLLGVIVAILIYGVGTIFNVTVWLLGQIGVLFLRFLRLLIRGGRWVVDRIRDARL